MTNADWWARVVQARTAREDLEGRRPASAPRWCSTVDGEWRRSRLFRSHEQAELSNAIADTRATFEAKGWV
jgi:hypothetical protein